MARTNLHADYDFIGFTYNGYHSIDDLGIYRVSSGNKFTLDMPTIQDQITDIAGGHGQSLIHSVHTDRKIAVNFVFDSLTEEGIRNLQKVLVINREAELVFDEYPYRAYDVILSRPPVLKCIPFDDINGQRIYKGEGIVEFIAYNPYAHTPKKSNIVIGQYPHRQDFSLDIDLEEGDYYVKDVEGGAPSRIKIYFLDKDPIVIGFTDNKSVKFQIESKQNISKIEVFWDVEANILEQSFTQALNLELYRKKEDGVYESVAELIGPNYLGTQPHTYSQTGTKHQWIASSGLNATGKVNNGDMPAPFVAEIAAHCSKGKELTIGTCSIQILEACSDVVWDSSTGMVTGKVSGVRRPIFIKGNARGVLPLGPVTIPQEVKLKYSYWYY